MQVILDYIAQHGEINNENVQEILGVKRTRAYTILNRWSIMALLPQAARGKEKKYYAAGK